MILQLHQRLRLPRKVTLLLHDWSWSDVGVSLRGRCSIWRSCSVTFRLIDLFQSYTMCSNRIHVRRCLIISTMFMSCCLACVTIFLTCLACLKVSFDPWHVLESLVTIREDVCPRRSWNRTCWLLGIAEPFFKVYLEALHATWSVGLVGALAMKQRCPSEM